MGCLVMHKVYRAATVRWAPLDGQSVITAIIGYAARTPSTVLTSRFATGGALTRNAQCAMVYLFRNVLPHVGTDLASEVAQCLTWHGAP